MEVILIRHGQTEGSRKNQYIGSTDEALCLEGKVQLLKAKRTGFYPEARRVYSSPLRRCIESAQVIYPEAWPLVIPGFREKSYGRYEGKAYPDLKDDEPYQAWVRSCGKLPFPDGEADESVKQRILTAFDQIVTELRMSGEIRHPGVGAAFVVHAGTIMTILSERLTEGCEQHFWFATGNGDYFRAELTEMGFRLMEKKRIPNQ